MYTKVKLNKLEKAERNAERQLKNVKKNNNYFKNQKKYNIYKNIAPFTKPLVLITTAVLSGSIVVSAVTKEKIGVPVILDQNERKIVEEHITDNKGKDEKYTYNVSIFKILSSDKVTIESPWYKDDNLYKRNIDSYYAVNNTAKRELPEVLDGDLDKLDNFVDGDHMVQTSTTKQNVDEDTTIELDTQNITGTVFEGETKAEDIDNTLLQLFIIAVTYGGALIFLNDMSKDFDSYSKYNLKNLIENIEYEKECYKDNYVNPTNYEDDVYGLKKDIKRYKKVLKRK